MNKNMKVKRSMKGNREDEKEKREKDETLE